MWPQTCIIWHARHAAGNPCGVVCMRRAEALASCGGAQEWQEGGCGTGPAPLPCTPAPACCLRWATKRIHVCHIPVSVSLMLLSLPQVRGLGAAAGGVWPEHRPSRPGRPLVWGGAACGALPADAQGGGAAGPPCCDAGWHMCTAPLCTLYPSWHVLWLRCMAGRPCTRGGLARAGLTIFGPLLHFALREACPLVYGRWFVGGVCVSFLSVCAVSRTGCGDGCGGVCWVFCMCGRGVCVPVGRCLLTAQVGLAPSLGCMVGVVEVVECVSKGMERRARLQAQ